MYEVDFGVDVFYDSFIEFVEEMFCLVFVFEICKEFVVFFCVEVVEE